MILRELKDILCLLLMYVIKKLFWKNLINFQQALQQNESPQVLYAKALFILSTTINLVKDLPQCSIGVRYISNLFPDIEKIGKNIL